MKGKIEDGRSVLVHSGYTVLGEAIIAVALSYKCSVFTAVNTKEQELQLRRRFQNVSIDVSVRADGVSN